MKTNRRINTMPVQKLSEFEYTDLFISEFDKCNEMNNLIGTKEKALICNYIKLSDMRNNFVINEDLEKEVKIRKLSITNKANYKDSDLPWFNLYFVSNVDIDWNRMFKTNKFIFDPHKDYFPKAMYTFSDFSTESKRSVYIIEDMYKYMIKNMVSLYNKDLILELTIGNYNQRYVKTEEFKRAQFQKSMSLQFDLSYFTDENYIDDNDGCTDFIYNTNILYALMKYNNCSKESALKLLERFIATNEYMYNYDPYRSDDDQMMKPDYETMIGFDLYVRKNNSLDSIKNRIEFIDLITDNHFVEADREFQMYLVKEWIKQKHYDEYKEEYSRFD